MKDKIFIYTPYSGSFYDKYLYHLVNTLNYEEIIIGSPHNFNIKLPKNTTFLKLDNLNYWSKANDYKEINAVLELLINLKISSIFCVTPMRIYIQYCLITLA